jgi:hypothetical protein
MYGGAEVTLGAVAQEEIDYVLIGHAEFGRHFFEVVNRRGIKADGDLTLEMFDVGVFAGFGKVVFASHWNLQ